MIMVYVNGNRVTKEDIMHIEINNEIVKKILAEAAYRSESKKAVGVNLSP